MLTYDFSNPRPPNPWRFFLIKKKGIKMRRILFTLIICFNLTAAKADLIIGELCYNPCIEGDIGSACSQICSMCDSEFKSISGGVITTITQSLKWMCGTPVTCSCDVSSRSYSCAAGYFGTAIDAFNGCMNCPIYATCPGGNNSTFTCNAGYYKNGTACTSCKTATGNSNSTSAAGATSITNCYVPSGTTESGDSGDFTYMTSCYYSL